MLISLSERIARGVFVLAAVVAAGSACRYQTIWSGVEYSENGEALLVAAEEPFCGCLTVENTSQQALHLSVGLHSERVGEVVLGPDERGEWRFDWAGHSSEDVYEITGATATGQPVVLRDATRMTAVTRWRDCRATTCDYGPLQMNLAEAQER